MPIYIERPAGSDSVQEGVLTAFGEQLVAPPTPVTQMVAPYGLLEKAEGFPVVGGSVAVANGMFEASTGTDPNSLAALLTRRQVTYRAGQGLSCRFSAVFDAPQLLNRQTAGFITNTDSLGFGYHDTGLFGIVYTHHGASEIQELTITTAATGPETASILIGGVSYNVPLTSGSLSHNAIEIAMSLDSQIFVHDFTANGDTVVARSLLADVIGAFDFSSGTAAGTWTQEAEGKPPVRDFTPQTEWNIDTRPTLIPQLGNVYQIKVQYLGFGAIDFYLEDQDTGILVLVHRLKYANAYSQPSLGNPTFRVGWVSANVGNTSVVTVRGGSAAGFVEGAAVRTEGTRALKVVNPAVPVNAPTNMVSLRNRLVFGNRRNRVEAFGLRVTAANDSNKPGVIDIWINADTNGDLEYSYIDKVNSVVEIATNSVPVLTGRLVGSFAVPPTGSAEFSSMTELANLVLPGQVMTISASLQSGNASEMLITVTWQEDI